MSSHSEIKKYPFDIVDLGPEETEKVYKHFSEGSQDVFVRVGPKGYLFPNGFRKQAENIYNLPLKHDDTWVVTFPKSGTTWVQELVWLVVNDFDFEKAKANPLVARFTFLEWSATTSEASKANIEKLCGDNEKHLEMLKGILENGVDALQEKSSPRFVKTHLPLSLLPPQLLDTCKVVHVARDPRDTAVSFYHHSKFFHKTGYTGGFKEYWNYFINDLLNWTPYFENVKESWNQRHNPNMLFLFYEDLLKDLPSAVRCVASFLGKPATEEQVALASEHLSFQNFKNNKSVNLDFTKEIGLATEGSFIRKGKSGGWREYFDEEMSAQAQRWINDNLRGTDLRFPQSEKY